MKVIFVSNFFIFHQSGLWDEIVKHEDIAFTFLATDDNLPDDRKAMKYIDESRSYVKRSYQMTEHDINHLFKDVDIVIYGNNEDDRVSKAIEDVPNLIVCAEHLSRRKSKILNMIALFKWFVIEKHYHTKGNKYLLAMSQYSYKDFKNYGFKNHAYRFGYFPDLVAPVTKKDPYSIIWFGRFLRLKGVDYTLQTLKILRQQDDKYHLTLIGDGEDLPRIKELAEKEMLNPFIEYKPFMNHDEIMEALASSSIFVFGSDEGEGWGVALNEALASGCICFVNEKAGSARFLINHGVNGYLFKDSDSLKILLEGFRLNKKEQVEKMREEARTTISGEWNNKTAAFRLYELLLNVYNHMDFDRYQSGPISKIK